MQVLSLQSEFRRTHRNFPARFINVEFADCPVETSLNTLGKKWAMLIIRDIGVYAIHRFNQLLKSLDGIPSKVLATRLKQLEREEVEKKMNQIIEKSREWGNKIPIGIFYQNETIPTYQDRIKARIPSYLTEPPSAQQPSKADGTSPVDLSSLSRELLFERLPTAQ